MTDFDPLVDPDPPVGGQKRVTVRGATGGFFTFTIGRGLNVWRTGPIPHDASAERVQTELRKVPGLERVTVVGEDGSPWTISGDHEQVLLDRDDTLGLTGMCSPHVAMTMMFESDS
jgi:hypothetical protein